MSIAILTADDRNHRTTVLIKSYSAKADNSLFNVIHPTCIIMLIANLSILYNMHISVLSTKVN